MVFSTHSSGLTLRNSLGTFRHKQDSNRAGTNYLHQSAYIVIIECFLHLINVPPMNASLRPAPKHHDSDRLQNDSKINPNRPFPYILHIKNDLLLRLQIIPAVYLREPCKPRLHLQPIAELMYVGLKLLIEALTLRARSDYTQLALQDIPELR